MPELIIEVSARGAGSWGFSGVRSSLTTGFWYFWTRMSGPRVGAGSFS